MEGMGARMEKLEKKNKKIEEAIKKLEEDGKKHDEAIKTLKDIVREHEKKWNRVRTYELLDNGSKFKEFENFKPSRMISLKRHEIVHGGDVLRDLQALESVENNEGKESFLAASKGFERLYGLSAEQYGSKIIEAQESHEKVLDVLNMKSNMQILYSWKLRKDRQNLLEMADSIIRKWKSDVEGHVIYSKCDFYKDYKMLRMRYQSSRC